MSSVFRCFGCLRRIQSFPETIGASYPHIKLDEVINLLFPKLFISSTKYRIRALPGVQDFIDSCCLYIPRFVPRKCEIATKKSVKENECKRILPSQARLCGHTRPTSTSSASRLASREGGRVCHPPSMLFTPFYPHSRPGGE